MLAAALLVSSASATEPAQEPGFIGDLDGVVPAAQPVRAPSAPIGALPEPVRQAALAARGLPLAERIGLISASLLGRPYTADPLGEGEGPDPDPLTRYDTFDCLTFVEEVLALALAGDPDHAGPVRMGLRYGDQPVAYAKRRHFMELQWIPGNLADGRLIDVTRTIGATNRLEKVVTEATWRGWRQRARFQLADDELPVGTMQLDVLSIDEALAHLDAIPAGAVLLTVRVDRPGVPLWVTHVGLTVPADKPTVRHATRMAPASTRDHDLRWYLEHLRTYSNWPVAGVAVLLPVEPGPRATDEAR